MRLGCPVERLLTRDGRIVGVAGADGWSGSFDAVASNADVVHTYRDLLSHEPLARLPERRLLRKRYSMSLFVIYFGTRCAYPDVAHHSILFGPRYRELLRDIFDRGTLADDFSLYLHAPDPDRSVPGAAGLRELLRPVTRCPTSARRRSTGASIGSTSTAIASSSTSIEPLPSGPPRPPGDDAHLHAGRLPARR